MTISTRISSTLKVCHPARSCPSYNLIYQGSHCNTLWVNFVPECFCDIGIYIYLALKMNFMDMYFLWVSLFLNRVLKSWYYDDRFVLSTLWMCIELLKDKILTFFTSIFSKVVGKYKYTGQKWSKFSDKLKIRFV